MKIPDQTLMAVRQNPTAWRKATADFGLVQLIAETMTTDLIQQVDQRLKLVPQKMAGQIESFEPARVAVQKAMLDRTTISVRLA